GHCKAEAGGPLPWEARTPAPRPTTAPPARLSGALSGTPAGPNGGVAGLAALFGGARDGGVGSLTSQLSSLPGLGQAASAAGGALPPGATPASGLQALGPMGALAQTPTTPLPDPSQNGGREIHLTISWKEGKRTESIDLVTDVVSLRPGSDRNGTPGAPLSATSTTGVPGVPGVPGLPLAPGGVLGGVNSPNTGQFYGPNR